MLKMNPKRLPPLTAQGNPIHSYDVPKGYESNTYSSPIPLPPYKKVCWFSSDTGRWPGDANRELPWTSYQSLTDILYNSYNPITSVGNQGMLALFELCDGNYLVIYALADEQSLSCLHITTDGRLEVQSSTLGSAPLQSTIPQFAYAIADCPFKAFSQAWVHIHKKFSPAQGSLLRENKNYPEPFQYLGWCTWEQYKTEISDELILDSIKNIKKSDIPIRWILIDDGFQDANNLTLRSFRARQDRFPQQWKNITQEGDEKIKWFGLWHCYFGHYNGIMPDNQLATASKKGLLQIGNVCYPGKSQKDIEQFYHSMLTQVQQDGFDFVKIDLQAEFLPKLMGKQRYDSTLKQWTDAPNINPLKLPKNPVQINQWCAKALEKTVFDKKLQLMNCMAHGSINLLNTAYSNSTRCSIDYKLNNQDAAKSHIYQSFHNSLWIGQSAWPDHDMFHSSDKTCGELMAISKALSGAPIYLSDAPEHFQPENILPLADKEGKLARPLAPAVPLKNSLFINPFLDKVLYGVIAPLPHQAAAICFFNLTAKEKAIDGILKVSDYTQHNAMLKGKEMPKKPKLVAYNWKTRKGINLEKDHNFYIYGFNYELFIVAPVQNNWAILGRSDKYLGTCFVESYQTSPTSLSITLNEAGPFVIWHPLPIMGEQLEIQALDNGFWLCTPKDLTQKNHTLTQHHRTIL